MKKADRYLRIVEWSEEDQCYIGRAPGLTLGGIHGQNETEVYQELSKLIEEWIEIHHLDNTPLPPAVAGKKYSGKFNLRVGPELHQRLVIESLKANESLNNYCVRVLRSQADLGG